MRIVLTGGGTGGHFYPLIAVAEATRAIADKEKLVGLKMYYYSDSPYDKEALFENGIEYREITAGKLRVYGSSKNIFDMFKAAFGTIEATFSLFYLYPDVIFSKGGYSAFPVIFAARILRIPVIIHESDTVPGRVNIWAGKFAKRVAVSYDEAAVYFPKDKAVVTGQPLREIIKEKKPTGSFEYLKLDPTVPTLLVLGGSLGAEAINNAIIDALPELLKKYQIIHQTGINNFDEIAARAKFITQETPELAARYKPFTFLNPLALKMAAGAASLVISRAGSTIFEIAAWGIPSIIIPIPAENSNGDHQRKNAFNYARHGAATVIEQGNLSTPILLSEISHFFEQPGKMEKMSAAAKAFATPDAAAKIAREVVDIALSHER